jgi:hypothetical protein
LVDQAAHEAFAAGAVARKAQFLLHFLDLASCGSEVLRSRRIQVPELAS